MKNIIKHCTIFKHKYSIRNVIVFIFLLMFNVNSYSQYFSTGADPASIKWKKIETQNFKVVFPQSYEKQAQYLAKAMEEAYNYVSNSLNHKPRKISVLMHSETAYSNGLVTWAPKRIELYNNPNQNMYAQDWIPQLAIHEFRHVVQIDKLNAGYTKILSYIFGEQAIGAVLGIFTSSWFLEGDAVATETALSESGRGRSPWFEQGMRAQIMEKGVYSYEKSFLGSYKDYTPNHYEMGYLLVAGARAKYGAQIWEDAMRNVSQPEKFAINLFSSGQKKYSKQGRGQLFSSTFEELKRKWEIQDSLTPKSKYQIISNPHKVYTNVMYPIAVGERFIALTEGMGKIDQFVWVNKDGSIDKIFTPGTRNTEPFSYANNTLCWAELEPDPRWENRMYSVVKTYNIETKKLSKITHKSRYSAPAISHDLKQIAAVSVDNKDNYRLVILNAKTGKLIKEYTHGDNNYLFTPQWNHNGTQILCIALSSKGKIISVLDLNTGEWQQITQPTFTDISHAKWGNNGEIIFTAGYSGTEEIYSVNNGNIQQLTQSKYGARFGTPTVNGIAYSYYTADGYVLAESDNANLLNIPLSDVSNNSIKLYEILAAQESGKPDFSSIDTIADYKVEKYSKWNIFNFHSWAPASVDIDNFDIGLGANAVSQNLLGTATTSLDYSADSQDQLERFKLNFNYQGWYPVIDLDVINGFDKVNYSHNNKYITSNNEIISIGANDKRNQTQINLNVSIPFNLTRSKYHVFFRPTVGYGSIFRSGFNYEMIEYELDADNSLNIIERNNFTESGVNFHSLRGSLYFHHLLRRSERDVTYRWGQAIELSYNSSLWGKTQVGSTFGLNSNLYFPGVAKHHSIQVVNSYQAKYPEPLKPNNGAFQPTRSFGNYFSPPRGYSNMFNYEQMYLLKVDYILPLWNADVNLPGVVYLKRVTGNLFYDYLNAKGGIDNSSLSDINISSTGLETRGEFYFLRFSYPVQLGYRYSRLTTINQNKHELIFGISISGFDIGKK